jgi:predicted Zn-dependent peptidase
MHHLPSPPEYPTRRFFIALALVPILAGAATLEAQVAGRISAEQYSLPNGLTVLLAPDRSAPVVAVDVWYRAGSREEPPGKAGLARMFERLMFAGSASLPAGTHGNMVEDVGGQFFAEVDEEKARFGEILPTSRLNLGLWLESERMRSPQINDTTVSQARLALLEDLGRQVDEAPYTAAIVDAVAALYDSTACPGYAHPTMGRGASITGLTAGDAQTFFHERYGPNNARLAVVGDFDPAIARQLITEYFGGIPRGSDAPAASCTPTPNTGARKKSVSDRQLGRLAVGKFYNVPAHDHPDSPALELLGVILSQGNDSRLARVLAGEARATVGTQGGILADRRGPEVFGLFAVAAPGVTADSLGALLAAQAAWAGSEGLGEADLKRAKNIYLATAVGVRERPGDIAEQLLHAATFHGSPDDVNAEVGRVMAATVADLRRVAKAWLTPENALTLVVNPEPAS